MAKLTAEFIEKFENELHRHFSHPDYVYCTLEGGRKSPNYHFDIPPDEDKGWILNEAAGRCAWERYDDSEECYWMRKRKRDEKDKPTDYIFYE